MTRIMAGRKKDEKKTASVAFKDRFAHHRRGQSDGIVVPTKLLATKCDVM